MWARIASSAAAPSRASMARTIASCSSSAGRRGRRRRARWWRPAPSSGAPSRAAGSGSGCGWRGGSGGGSACWRGRARPGRSTSARSRRDHLPEDADLLGRGVLGGEAGGQALELGAHHVELAELVVVEARDHEAAAVAGEHRLGLEPLQRLADRACARRRSGRRARTRPAGRRAGTRRGRSPRGARL